MTINYSLAEQLGKHLQQRGETITTAESCTGGGLAFAITSVAGSSNWFERAFVTYSNEAKSQMLEISPELITQQGAVSEAVALAMANGALRLSHATWSIGITGIAGPDGGSPEKPVGTVWIAWANASRSHAKHFLYSGNREAIREQAIHDAICHIMKLFL